MEDRETTVRSRELGEGLRAAMRGAGLSGTDVARKLGWSQGRVSRLLSGKRGGTEIEVVSFLTICEVKGAERERLLQLSHEQSRPGWLQQHGDRLPKQLRTLIDHEDKAVSIDQFQPMIVPGLLQTDEYARALISNVANVPAEEVEDRVAARLARQSLFSRRPPVQFHFLLHEFVLRLQVGTPEAMSDQLHHLLRMSVRPHLTLQVVPASIGVHPGVAGQFQLMEFGTFKPVVYVDSETSCLFLEAPSEIAAYRRVLEGLADKSLDAGQSRELIASLATELYSSGEDRDEQA